MSEIELGHREVSFRERSLTIACVENDYLTRAYFDSGVMYEEPLLNYICDTYKDLDVFVDIGGFIGTHSMVVGQFVGAKEIHVYEPNLFLNPCIISNLVGLPYALHSYALGDFNTTGGLSYCEGNLATAKYAPEGQGTFTRYLDVEPVPNHPMSSLDIDLIKIDVEGMEVQVVEGAIEKIRQYLPDLIVEHLDVYTLQDTYRLLKPLGYTLDVFLEKEWEMYLYNSPRKIKQV